MVLSKFGRNKKFLIMLSVLLLAGCGQEGEDDNIDAGVQETTGNDAYEQETEENPPEENPVADMDGWVNEGEEQEYIWGTWTVTGIWNDRWKEESYRMGGIYELSPDGCFYEDGTVTGSAKLKEYDATVVGEHGAHWYHYKFPGDYCLQIGLTEENDDPDDFIMFSTLYLVERDVMVGVDGPRLYRLERTGDYDGRIKGEGFGVSSIGIWYGDWEITGVLKAAGKDAEQYIGEVVDMTEHEDYKRVIMKDVSRFYVVDTEEKSIRKLVEAMGVEDEFFVGFYEFKEGYEWDQMIIKDEITVVLVKDGNYFWAERVYEDEGDLEAIYGI